eukprot:569062-Pelagomonas_calceolata.AAC.1
MPPKAKSQGHSTPQKRTTKESGATKPGHVESEGQGHVPKPASFYAEEHDLHEPEMQEVEREIEEEIQSSRHHPSQELTLRTNTFKFMLLTLASKPGTTTAQA